MGEHLIKEELWQRVLEALRREPYMHLSDLGRLRRFVSACFLVLRRNCTWAELGCFAPSADAAKRRFSRWAKKGVWERLLQRSQPLAEPDVLHVDSTSIKYHRTATGACGGAEEAIGRSRGGLTTKVHHAVNGLGFVRRLLTSPGQHADCRHAEALTAGLKPLAVVGDKGYRRALDDYLAFCERQQRRPQDMDREQISLFVRSMAERPCWAGARSPSPRRALALPTRPYISA